MNIPRDVGRHDGGEGGGEQTGRGALGDLGGEEVGGDRSQRREDGRDEHTHVADVDRQVQEVHDPVEHGGGEHQAGVDGASDGAAQRVPSTVIEPIQKLKETLMSKIFCRTEIEVRVELVNDRLVSNHREETDREGKQTDQTQDCELQHSGDTR